MMSALRVTSEDQDVASAVIELSATQRSSLKMIISRALLSGGLISGTLTPSLLSSGCGGYAIEQREPEPRSAELEERDLKSMFERASASLQESGLARLWEAYQRQGKQLKIGLLSLDNQTKSPVDALAHTLLVELGDELKPLGVSALNRVGSPELAQQLRAPESQAIDKQKVAELGAELGVEYLITGKLYTVIDPSDSASTPHHYLFLQVIDVKRGSEPWRYEGEALR